MIIEIDVDDTLAQYMPAFRKFATRRLRGSWDAPRLPEPQSWRFHKEWGITKEELRGLMSDFIGCGYLMELLPVEDSQKIVKALKERGHHIAIVTARGAVEGASPSAMVKIQRETAGWLADHGIDYDSLHFTPDKSVVQAHLMLDDAAHHLQRVYETSSRTHVVAFNAPHNQAFRVNYVRRHRVSSWREFYSLAVALEEKL